MKKSLSLFSVFLVFLAMGFGDAAGQLVSVVKDVFKVSPFMASFVSFFGLIMFGVLSVPMGVVQSRIGKKSTLIIGLLLFLAGAVLPVLAFSFPVILLSVFLMGAGAAILQVSGNPMMRDVSAEGKYSSNLSFAQSVKAIGTLSTSLIIAIVGTLLSEKYGWFKFELQGTQVPIDFRILFPIFAVILLVTLSLVVFFVPNAKNEETEKPTTVGKCIKALGNPYILMMFLGIFFYCGAEASMFNQIPTFLKENNLNMSPAIGNIVLIVALFVGRFVGGFFLRYMKPNTFLYVTIGISVLGNVLLFLPYNSVITWLSFILIGLGFANIFPLIFSMCIDRMPDKSNEISGLMTTAIVGAGIVPLLTGAAANINFKYAFIVTLACLAYLTFVAMMNSRKGNETLKQE